MRALIQRVKRASVTIDGVLHSSTGAGMLVLLGVEVGDTEADLEWLAGKVARLRIFDDEQGVMNRDVVDVSGDIMVVSQFTLCASTKKGNRPSYIAAAREEEAVPMYESFKRRMGELTGCDVACGVFGADMAVELINDGPVTIWIDSRNRY
ncbi:MAG: D-tyrosyl-tRNA(Tyr) deacylase [Rikenellaceae bacterium]|nr:D-tyrosyl-tRNA(Tyr) deacylase [Rikenellaceae bacterium]